MENYLDYDVKTLDKNNAYWTAKEICQQPQMWEKNKLNCECTARSN